MSRKEIEDSKHYTTRAQKAAPKRGKTTFLDGVKVSKQVEENKPVEILYAAGGISVENPLQAMAKKIVHEGGRQEFFVKFATAGVSSGRMLNPWGFSYNIGDELKYEKTMGRYRYEFKKVKESVFDSYFRFLETRNERHLLNAEREAING